MQKITINGESKSEILVGEHLSNLHNYLPTNNVVIISDKNLTHYYSNQFPSFPLITIGTGESIKTLATVDEIVNKLLDFQADRKTFLLGIGGGIVCDIVGFVASVYMRGIDFAFVSTSLLSQVDASVGGKNGVNHNAFKNIIGCFNQPRFVICDTQMLDTLPQKEFLSGMAEVIKHALITDADMFDLISQQSDQILALNRELIVKLIYDNIKIKAGIVEQDERELAERKKLNFGHTLAHAIEKHSDISHGEAVAIGIVFASKVSCQKKYITEADLKYIIKTIKQLGLPVDTQINKEKLKDAIMNDKKRNRKKMSFILLEEIGRAKIEEIEIDDLKQLIDDLC